MTLRVLQFLRFLGGIKRFRVIRRFRTAGVLACVAVLAACSSAGDLTRPFEALTGQERSRSKNSLFGNYLAARHAGAVRDTASAADYYASALARDPDNEVILDRAFLLQLADGQVEEATRRAREIIRRTPDKNFPHLIIGLSDYRDGDYGRARYNFERSADGPFSSLASTLLIAWAHRADGEVDVALELIDNFNSNPAFDIFRFYHRALINEQAGRVEAADRDFQATLDSGGSNSIRAVQAYGQFLERQGRKDDAIALYTDFARAAPNHPLIEVALRRIDENIMPGLMVPDANYGAAEVLYGLASALARDRSIDLPFVYLQLTLYMRDDFDVALLLLADLMEAVGRWEEAADVYARVPSDSGIYSHAQLQIAFNLERLERGDDAVRFLRKVTQRRPDDMDAVVALGDLLRSRKDYDESAEVYAQAINLAGDPQRRHWSLFYARGIAYERSGRWEDAERDFKFALELEPDQPLVLNYLGYSWVEQRQNLDEALEMIRLAVELRPNDGYIVDSLGWAHYQLGQYEIAVEHLEQAVSLRPEDPVINDHLGDAYWKVGREIEARFQWQRALGLGPEDDQVPLIEKKLDRGMRGSHSRHMQKAERPLHPVL